jgi:cell division transport system ATP-binding protein
VLSGFFVFQKNKLVLTGVNLSIGEGEFVYLIGKTGSGKSSLMKILYAGLPVEKGTGFVAGYDLRTEESFEKTKV